MNTKQLSTHVFGVVILNLLLQSKKFCGEHCQGVALLVKNTNIVLSSSVIINGSPRVRYFFSMNIKQVGKLVRRKGVSEQGLSLCVSVKKLGLTFGIWWVTLTSSLNRLWGGKPRTKVANISITVDPIAYLWVWWDCFGHWLLPYAPLMVYSPHQMYFYYASLCSSFKSVSPRIFLPVVPPCCPLCTEVFGSVSKTHTTLCV